DAAGQPVGGWHPEETVSRESALDGFTRTAAYAAFAEDRLGTLMPGMRADFVMLESDPLHASPDEIRKIAKLQIDKLAGRLAAQGVTLKTTEAALDALAERGYDVTFGARPLKRVIQREIENPLAIRLLKRSAVPEEGETITLDADEDGFVFQP
ncbi:MAG: amidohydrolase family protein, partial [Thermoguttaceae bacterium]|nr:amidohydrolase family protein [Thermoguttaceae bacterium]